MIVGAGKAGGAVDRDAIVIEEDDQLAELEMPGQGSRFMADPLHQAAVASDHIGVVIDQFLTEAGSHDPLCQGHADRIAETLTQGTGCRLNSRSMAILWMAGSAAAELAEVLQLLQGHVRIAGEIEEGIKQHRAVPGGKDEAVAIGPMGTLRVKLQEALEKDCCYVSHT